MEYGIDFVKNILNNLKKDPMRLIYTEHCLDEIEKRNISDIRLEELLENSAPLEINRYPNYNNRFELKFALDDSRKLTIILDTLNRDTVILISAFPANNEIGHSKEKLEFEFIYDSAFNLMEMHSKNDFEYGQTVEMEKGFNIDFDPYGQPVAIEIIRPSKRFRLTRKIFPAAAFEGRIEITCKSIRIALKASVNSSTIEPRILEKEIANDYGIPVNSFELAFEKRVS